MPQDHHGGITYPNRIAYFVCTQSRIPSLAVFGNDANSWFSCVLALLLVLVFFMSLILLVVAVYETLRWLYIQYKFGKSGDREGEKGVAGRQIKINDNLFYYASYTMYAMLLLGLLFFLFVVLCRFYMPTLDNPRWERNRTATSTSRGLVSHNATAQWLVLAWHRRLRRAGMRHAWTR